MKTTAIKCFAAIMAVAVLAGCASKNTPAASGTRPAQIQAEFLKPSPGMKKMNVTLVVEDQRPVARQLRYGSSNIERPEHYFNNTINLSGYTINYLNDAKLFNSVTTTNARGNYVLKLVWKSAHLNVNGWIPFVIRFQNHMTIDMSLSAPNGKVLWKHTLNGHVVNTPSSFRPFSTHRCDLFQERVLQNHYPAAFGDMCQKLAQLK